MLQWIGIALICGLQAATLHFYFPDALWFSTTPLYHVDYPLMEYVMELARQFWSQAGRLWGVDFLFLAGYPLSFLWNSNVLLQLLAVVFPTVPSALLIQFFFVGILLCQPWFLYHSLRNFRFEHLPALLATVMALIWLQVGLANLYLTFGMLTGYAVYFVGLYSISWVFRFLETPSWLHWGLLTFWGAVALLFHKSFLILMIPVAIATMRLIVSDSNPRLFLIRRLSLSALLILLSNGFWLWPAWDFRRWLDFSHSPFWQNPGYLMLDVMLVKNYWWSAPFVMALVLGVLSMSGMWHLRKASKATNDSRWSFFIIPWMGWLFLVFVVPWISWIEGWHPVRYFFLAVLWLTIPMAESLRRVLEKPLLSFQPWLLTVAVVLALVLPSVQSHEELPKWILEDIKPFDSAESPAVSEVKELAHWIQNNTTQQHAIFLELGAHNAHLTFLYGLWTHRRFVNSPYQFLFLKQNQVSRYFHECLQSPVYIAYPKPNPFPWKCDSFEKLADWYDIQWWILRSPLSQELLKRHQNPKQIATVGSYHIYESSQPRSRFFKGDGKISIEKQRLTIEGVRPGNGQLILKWHWFPELEVLGAQGIKPYFHEGHPFPWILIEQPGESIQIW